MAVRLRPVFPLVGSTMPRPGLPGPSSPRRSRSLSIAQAARSFTEPKGFIHSSLAQSCEPSGTSRLRRTIGDGFSSSGSSWVMSS